MRSDCADRLRAVNRILHSPTPEVYLDTCSSYGNGNEAFVQGRIMTEVVVD